MANIRIMILGLVVVAVLGTPPLTPLASADDSANRASSATGALTWNMCGDKPKCGTSDEAVDRRVEQVVNQAEKHPVIQVIALQEICGARHYPMIKERLGDNWMGNFWRKPMGPGEGFKPCGIEGGNYIGSAVLVKNPSASATRVDKAYEGNNIRRERWGAACINDLNGNTPLYACSAHLPPAAADECGEERRALVGKIDAHMAARQAHGPTIFGADFNINSNDRSGSYCTDPPVGPQNNWLDRLRDHSIGINLALETTDGGSTIDHIFFGHRVVDYERHHASTVPSGVSDHHILKGYVTDKGS